VVARLSSILGLFAVLFGIYALLIRPAQLHWGATSEELARAMPEDAIVAHPAFDATRAITIHGHPEDIWPWLVQMGYGRAGFYGYDLIENPGGGAGIHSTQSILPAFQNPKTGDLLPISVAATLVYGSIRKNSYIVWRSRDVPSDGVYIWELVPIDSDHTRLISRIRWNYLHSALGIALGLLTEVGDHVAVRAILRGIRDRVEGRRPGSLWIQAAEIAGWFLALFELILAVVLLLRWRSLGRAWLVALGAGLLLQLLLYGPQPVWVSAPLPWLYLALLVWVWRSERARGGICAKPNHQELLKVT
jgi:hypothetical protein